MSQRSRLDDETQVYGDGETLRYFANTYLQFLQVVFSSAAAPPDYRHSSNTDQANLLIEGASADNLEQVDQRPKIVVQRGAFRWHNQSGIGQIHEAHSLSQQQQKSVSDLVTGSVMISTISKEYLESEKLASWVVMLIRRFKQQLSKFGLLRIDQFEASSTGLVRGQDGGVQGYVTAVNINMSAQDTWLIENDSHVAVRKITTAVQQQVK